MAAPLTFWQKLQSFLYPISLRKGSSALNPVLELFYFRGRYILATGDAVYSDGQKYRPLVKAFETPALKAALPKAQSVLVLGTGLASAVHIMAAKGVFPITTLVEIDKLVLDWAIEFLPPAFAGKVRAVHADAFEFVATDVSRYDLIIVDIFFGRKVPDKVLDSDFLKQCKMRLSPGGFLVLNYMEEDSEQKGRAEQRLKELFKEVHKISFGINKVYIAHG